MIMHAPVTPASTGEMSACRHTLRPQALMVLVAACVVALVCAFGLAGCGSSASNGDDAAATQGDGSTFSVALTIVDATDGNKVVYNDAVSDVTSAMTVVDLLNAAGFSEVATLEETAGNDRTYVLTNDSPYFLGKGYDENTGCYWVTMFDGSSDNWANAMATSTLKPAGHYQYVYGTDMSFTYGGEIADPLP